MGRWDPLPPSPLQRWIARHASTLQLAYGCLAAVCGVLAIRALALDGLSSDSVVPLIQTVVFLGLLPGPRQIARYVSDYDRQSQHHST